MKAPACREYLAKIFEVSFLHELRQHKDESKRGNKSLLVLVYVLKDAVEVK